MASRDGLRSQVIFSMLPVWVLERCSSQAVHVYGFLMKYANRRDRRAWPKTELLAREMGKSLRTVERAIAELRTAGALVTSRRHRADGAVTGLEFVLIVVDPEDSLPAVAGGKGSVDHPATDGGKAIDHPATGVGAIPPTVSGLLKEEPEPRNQIQERTEERALPLPMIGRVFTGSDVDQNDPCERFRLAWNATIVEPLKPCQTLTPIRRRHIRAALVSHSTEAWGDIFARVAMSSFCRGEKGWIASFDWLIATPDAAVKVLEGQYDDRLSEQELRAARDAQSRVGGCRHEPRCGDWRICVRELALQLRARRAS